MRKKIVAMVLLVVMLLTMLAIFRSTSTTAMGAELDLAIDFGMQWLAAQQNVDGSWGTEDQVGRTGFAVLKFETHAVNIGEDPLDPTYEYNDHVRSGLDYMFANASVIAISGQPAGDPDTDGDGIGVYFGSYYARTYETGVAMMAIASSTQPERIVDVPGSFVDGWTYEDVLQDAVDYLAFGQTDADVGRGGWWYEECNNTEGLSDNSNTGYAVQGLAYAEASPPYGFGLTIPLFVKSELDIWINYIQNDLDGGSGYTAPDDWVNILKTGHLLCEMAFVGDTESTPRAVNATDYIVRHWNDANYTPGWRGPGLGGDPTWPACYQAMYTTMTGLESLGMEEIDGINWFNEFSNVLMAQQNSTDGSWPNAPLFGNEDGTPAIWDTDQIISTEWALLTLQKAFPPPIGEALYAGGSDPGVVYKYAGGTQWSIISPTLGNAVLCLCEYEGHLYAGTTSWPDLEDAIGQVWRYEGGTTWTLIGDNMDNEVCSLIVFRENLYAGTAYVAGRLYRYDGGTTWTMVVNYTRQDGDPPTAWSGFRSLYVWNDTLYIGDIGYDLFGHFDGVDFVYDADLGGSCIWDYEVYDNGLYASAFVGRVHRTFDGTTWTTIRDYQDYNSWELETFQGYLYITTGPRLERYDGVEFSLVWTESRGNETISMINTGDTLILGTGTERYGGPGVGRVYTYNGTQVQLISGDMGSGIQALLVALLHPPPPEYDVAVTYVTPSKTVVGQGYIMSINVTVENQGRFSASFNVTVYYGNDTLTPKQWETFWSIGDVNRDGYINDIDGDLITAAFGSIPDDPNWNPDADLNKDLIVDMDDLMIWAVNYDWDVWTYFNILGGNIGTQTVNDLSAGNSTTLVFAWNSTGVPYGSYVISAKTSKVLGETDTTDNIFDNGTIFVTVPGDVDGDGDVDGFDLTRMCGVYGSTRGDPDWDEPCDINGDGIIDGFDLTPACGNYGKTI